MNDSINESRKTVPINLATKCCYVPIDPNGQSNRMTHWHISLRGLQEEPCSFRRCPSNCTKLGNLFLTRFWHCDDCFAARFHASTNKPDDDVYRAVIMLWMTRMLSMVVSPLFCFMFGKYQFICWSGIVPREVVYNCSKVFNFTRISWSRQLDIHCYLWIV